MYFKGTHKKYLSSSQNFRELQSVCWPRFGRSNALIDTNVYQLDMNRLHSRITSKINK